MMQGYRWHVLLKVTKRRQTFARIEQQTDGHVLHWSLELVELTILTVVPLANGNTNGWFAWGLNDNSTHIEY